MAAVLRENQPETSGHSQLRKGCIEERRILMCVYEFNPPLLN